MHNVRNANAVIFACHTLRSDSTCNFRARSVYVPCMQRSTSGATTARGHLCWPDRIITLWPFSRIKCDFIHSLLGWLKWNTPVQHCGWDWNISATTEWVAIDFGFWLLCHCIWKNELRLRSSSGCRGFNSHCGKVFYLNGFPSMYMVVWADFMEDYEAQQLLLQLHIQRIPGNCDWLSAHKAWQKMVMQPA